MMTPEKRMASFWQRKKRHPKVPFFKVRVLIPARLLFDESLFAFVLDGRQKNNDQHQRASCEQTGR